MVSTPWHGMKKICCLKIGHSLVDENAIESDSLGEDPIALDKPYEDYEIKHDPFEFSNDDEIPFSRLLFVLTVW
jgi:hypothetical protein